MTISTFFTAEENVQILSDLDTTQARAFVDLLILTVLVDEVITEEELEALSEQWANMPFVTDVDLEQAMAAHGFETRAYLEDRISDESAVRDFLKERMTSLDTKDVKLAALRMVATVSSSDGVDDAETSFLRTVGEVLGVEEAHIKDVIADLNSN